MVTPSYLEVCDVFLWFQHNSDKASDSATGRKSVGLHFCTYRATVNRDGVFKSPACGQINFNEDLTDPIYKCLTIVWDRVFRWVVMTLKVPITSAADDAFTFFYAPSI